MKDLEKTANMNWLTFSLSVTTSADPFLYDGNGWVHDELPAYDEKNKLRKGATHASDQSSPKSLTL